MADEIGVYVLFSREEKYMKGKQSDGSFAGMGNIILGGP